MLATVEAPSSTAVSRLAGNISLTGELVSYFLVGTEQIANFTTSDADVSGWDICILSDMPGKFGHEGIAELADLVIGASLGIKVGAALSRRCGLVRVVHRRETIGMRTLPPPMFKPVKAFLNVCSKPRNLRMDKLTLGWSRSPPLYGPIAELNWWTISDHPSRG